MPETTQVTEVTEVALRFLKASQYLSDHLRSMERLFHQQMADFQTMASSLRDENEELKFRVETLEK